MIRNSTVLRCASREFLTRSPRLGEGRGAKGPVPAPGERGDGILYAAKGRTALRRGSLLLG